MNTRKLCGTVAAAIFTFALSATASAELYFECPTTAEFEESELRAETIDRLVDMADTLRCVSDGKWTTDLSPIWQHKGKASKGCTVHTRLARLVYEKRLDDGKPPRNKFGTNDAKGAAHDLTKATDEKDDSAIAQLSLFIQNIGDAVENKDMDDYATDFATAAGYAITCIGSL